MKKHLFFITTLAIGIIIVTACNNKINLVKAGDYADVSIVIGANKSLRSIGKNGLPELNDKNTTITVSDEKGKVIGEGKTKLKLKLKVGIKIKVKVKVKVSVSNIDIPITWFGTAEHTVVKGKNKVLVKLSKFAKSFIPLMYTSVYNKFNVIDNNLYLMIPGKDGINPYEALDNSNKYTSQPLYKFTRDGKGRIYCLKLDNTTKKKLLVRYNIDGSEDIAFSNKLKTNFANCRFISADKTTNYVYLLDNSKLYRVSEDGSYTALETSLFRKEPQLMFVNKNTIFIASSHGPKLLSYKITNNKNNFSIPKHDAPTASIDLKFGRLTDIYAEENNLYTLVNDSEAPEIGKQADDYTTAVARSRGFIQKYDYDYKNPKFTEKESYGLSGTKEELATVKKEDGLDNMFLKNSNPDTCFYGPEKFLGKDEDGNLYISDNGFKLEAINDWPRITGNVNRMAKFNPKAEKGKELEFDSLADPTDGKSYISWSKDWEVYDPDGFDKFYLLWGEDDNGKDICWLGDGTGRYKYEGRIDMPSNIYLPYRAKFCFDEEGNLYIAGTGDGNYYRVVQYKKDSNTKLYSEAKIIIPKDKNGNGFCKVEQTAIEDIAVDIANKRLYFLHGAQKDGEKFVRPVSCQGFDEEKGDVIDEIKYQVLDSNLDEYIRRIFFYGGNLYYGTETYTTNPNIKNSHIYRYNISDSSIQTSVEISEKIKIHFTSESGGKFTAVMDISDICVVNNSLYALYASNSGGINNGNNIFTHGRILKFNNISNGISSTDEPEIFFDKNNYFENSKSAFYPYRFIGRNDSRLIIANDGMYSDKNAKEVINNNSVIIFDTQESPVDPINGVHTIPVKAKFYKDYYYDEGSGTIKSK